MAGMQVRTSKATVPHTCKRALMPNTKITLRSAGTLCALVAGFFFNTPCSAATSSHEMCRAVPTPLKTIVVCKTNFYKLNTAKRFDNKYIEVTGFLHKSTNGYYMYASKDAYIYSGGRGGIYLEVDAQQEHGLEVEFADYDGAVTVVGLFTDDGGQASVDPIGRIKVLKSMFWRQEFPGEKPSLPRN